MADSSAPNRPLLLDLFCGAGGAAMGYHRAGFDVVGVDIKPQPRYPFEFQQVDVVDVPIGLLIRVFGPFDAIHASPPCQAFSAANNIHGRTDHPDLIRHTRSALIASGLPYVIENVPGAPLLNHVVICGLALGLNVKRHRWFESNRLLLGTDCPPGHPGNWVMVFGNRVLERGHEIGRTAKDGPRIRRKGASLERGQRAMGIDWMTKAELSQAIPPAYTEWIGKQLLAALPMAA